MESYKQEFIEFLLAHFSEPPKVPKILDFTAFYGISYF